MAKKKPKQSKRAISTRGVAGTRKTPNEKLAQILEDNDAVTKAVQTLLEMLNSTVEHWSKADEMMVLEVDGQTRTKAAQTLLAYAVGDPVKRQQILSGKLPSEAVDRALLMENIDKKIAAMVNRPDVTVSELLQAKKSLVEAEKDAPLKKLSEAELVAEAKRIHGMAEPPPELKPEKESTSTP